MRGPAYGWKRDQLQNIMKACVIMHNIIVEDEKGQLSISFEQMGMLVEPQRIDDLNEFIAAHHRLRDCSMCHKLKNDLIKHNWILHGGN